MDGIVAAGNGRSRSGAFASRGLGRPPIPLVLCAALCGAAAGQDGIQVRVSSPPFLGNGTGQHEVLEGREVVLQGVAEVYPTEKLVKARWDPGDGKPAYDVPMD